MDSNRSKVFVRVEVEAEHGSVIALTEVITDFDVNRRIVLLRGITVGIEREVARVDQMQKEEIDAEALRLSEIAKANVERLKKDLAEKEQLSKT